MQKTELVARLTEALAPEAEVHGFELVAVEQVGGRGVPVLRVLLDGEDGITLDEVASANEWVSAVIDAAEPFSHPYTLEVSSPGIDRPLTKREDFKRFAGQVVNLKVEAAEKRKSWTGAIVGVEGDTLVLDVDGEHVEVGFETIQKARLKGVVDFGKGREQSA